MFTIAICDDNDVFCKELADTVKEHLDSVRVEHEIFIYHSIQNIRYDFLEGIIYDLLFLDIVFDAETESGDELGNFLRNTLRNEYSQIVYVSGKEGFAMKLFDSRPFQFLIKPLEKQKVDTVLDKIIQIQNVGRELFSYNFSAKEYRIELRKILYFRSEGRKIKVICTEGEECFYYGKISDVYKELRDKKFFSPHKSYIVNYYAVEQWCRNEIIMINGDRVPVSRNKEAEMRELQMKYERG